MQKLEWEVLDDQTVEADDKMCTVHKVDRAKVPGGWLVRAYSATMSSGEGGDGHGMGVGVGLTFLPDANYVWKP